MLIYFRSSSFTDYGYGGGSSDESKKAASIGYSPDIGGGGGGSNSCRTNPGRNGAINAHMTSSVASSSVGRPLLSTPTTVCYEYSYPDSNSNHSKSGFVRPVSEHHYEQPMVVFPPSQSPSDSIGKPSRSETSASGTTTSRGSSSQKQPPSSPVSQSAAMTAFTSSTPVPPCFTNNHDPKFTVWSTVGNSGSRLTLPESDFCLTIPPGAISPGTTADFYLSVIHNVQNSPQIHGRETMLSSLVAVGPSESSVKLKKPAILTVPHCASLQHANWSVSVVSPNVNDGEWHKVVTLGQETLSTPLYAQLDLSMCHVIMDHLTSLALVGESAKSGYATKSLRLAAFAYEGPPASDLTVRVYCLPDTDDALGFATEAERRYNGRILCQPISVLFRDGGDNLCLNVESLGPSCWTSQKGADYLEVPFYHIWNSANPTLHCSFTFRNRERSLASQLNLTIGVRQHCSSSSSLLKINCDLRQPSLPSSPPLPPPVMELTSKSPFRLSQATICTLSTLLDPPDSQHGNDWRMLAERLMFNRYVNFFASRQSPTETILHLWESRNRELLAVSNLANILRGMGRFDAASALEGTTTNK